MEIYCENNIKHSLPGNEYYRFNRINWFSSIDYLIKDKIDDHLRSKSKSDLINENDQNLISKTENVIKPSSSIGEINIIKEVRECTNQEKQEILHEELMKRKNKFIGSGQKMLNRDSIYEDEFRRKEKGISEKKSPKKYTGVMPDQESVTVIDTSPTKTKPSAAITQRQTLEHDDEENIMQSEPLLKPKVFCSNKYIGVYKGKFGILTKKVPLPTKSEVEQRSIDYQNKLFLLHKRSADKNPVMKQSVSNVNHSSLDMRRVNSQSEIRLNIKEIGEGFDIGAKRFKNLKEDVRKSTDNVYKIRNRTNLRSKRDELTTKENSKSMNMVMYPTEVQKRIIKHKIMKKIAKAQKQYQK